MGNGAVREPAPAAGVHGISVVIPVYRGETTLPAVVAELDKLSSEQRTPAGHRFIVTEVVLVHDNGPDRSDEAIRQLAARYDFVRPVWLSRNYGQHPATFAGIASTGGDWVLTMDEDGQHDPRFAADLLDVAMTTGAPLVYAQPTNTAPHGAARNAASSGAKWVFGHFLSGGAVPSFQSYRLVLGELARSVAAYAGTGVYLDVALSWVAGAVQHCPVELRAEGGRPSGYSYRRLLSHFWRLVLSSGTRNLRIVSILGIAFALLGILVAGGIVVARFTDDIAVEGWASVVVVVLLGIGAMLFCLGVVAEYLGVAVNAALGRPPYLIVSDPAHGPLGRRYLS